MDRFISPTKGELSFKETVLEILEYIASEIDQRYEIIVGTDSKGRGIVDFVTAIVVHKIGKGGRYFWRKIQKKNMFSLPQIIFEEVSLSLETAQKLLQEIQAYMKYTPKTNYNFEIHVDVGEDGESKSIIKEVVGMVIGSGFSVKTKPEAYAATVVADRKC